MTAEELTALSVVWFGRQESWLPVRDWRPSALAHRAKRTTVTSRVSETHVASRRDGDIALEGLGGTEESGLHLEIACGKRFNCSCWK